MIVVVPMLCEEKDRLLAIYIASADCHAQVVSQLSRVRNKPTAFRKALANAKSKRETAERARLALKEHTETHGCSAGQSRQFLIGEP
jgi:hypothetical protein